jgi:hypothetical protein
LISNGIEVPFGDDFHATAAIAVVVCGNEKLLIVLINFYFFISFCARLKCLLNKVILRLLDKGNEWRNEREDFLIF